MIDTTGMELRVRDPMVKGLIRILQNDRLTFNEAIGEIVDNALDAAATEITIDIAPEKIEIRDNGHGCHDLDVMIQLGNHFETEIVDPSGIYGQGLDSAAAKLALFLEIETIHRGMWQRAVMDWEFAYRMGQWAFHAKPREPRDEASGTLIRLTEMRMRMPKAPFKSLIAYLSDNFTPGILRGTQISVNGIPVPAIQFPILTNVIETKLEMDGKFLTLRAGKMKEACADKAGFWFRASHRFLSQKVWACTGDIVSYNFHATVELINGTNEWQKERNKKGFAEAEAVYELVYPEVAALLETLAEEGEQIEVRELCEALESDFEWGFPGQVKGIRSRGPTVCPGPPHKNKGRRPKPGIRGGQPNKDGFDDVRNTRSGIALKIRFQSLPDTDDMLKVEFSRHACWITFNDENEIAQRWKKTRDRGQLYIMAVNAFVFGGIQREDFVTSPLLRDIEDPTDRYIKSVTFGMKSILKHLKAGKEVAV